MSLVYSASKSAVRPILPRTLAKELGPKKIRVNTIAPGYTVTEGTETSGLVGSQFETHMVANTPLAGPGCRTISPGVAVFLASDDANWVTGETTDSGRRLL